MEKSVKLKVSVVVTSINPPNSTLKAISNGCMDNNFDFILIGDTKSPHDFYLNGCNYYSISKQLQTNFLFAEKCPTGHYSRKNLGYLLAISEGSNLIFETDDDNYPLKNFWEIPSPQINAKCVENLGWINIYRYYTEDKIWPRGFPLQSIQNNPPDFASLRMKRVDSPIYQYMVNGNPDVDAICRFIFPLDQTFKENRIAIGKKTWCPFNSQATKWAKEAFALMYLPAFCSFRMTDIWRSFIAQRIAWENNWYVLFLEPMMHQVRNTHNLLRDFEDEIAGYLNNADICEQLERLDLKSGIENIPLNLNSCYEKLVSMKLVGERELFLLNTWLDDLNTAIAN